MKTIPILKIIFSLLLVWMCYKVIATSLESNAFTEWDFLGSIPRMRATLWDFYAYIFVIYLWIVYKERSLPIKILWQILLFCRGSIATCVYVLIQVFKLKPGADVAELIGSRN